MLLHPRLADILDQAKRRGRVDVDDLANRFAVTPQTIRKDLNELCDADLLQRIHGGAVFTPGVRNFAYDSRRQLAADGKLAIGNMVAELIPENSSLFLNIGTTTEQVAAALRNHLGLLIVTNSLNVANILAHAPGCELVIAGGMVRKSDGGIVGMSAIEHIRQFKVDFAVIGASGIDEEGCMLDFDYREVQVSQTIIKQSRKIVLVADSTKFSRRAPVQIGSLQDVDILVTDRQPPDEISDICRDNNVAVHVAGTQAAK